MKLVNAAISELLTVEVRKTIRLTFRRFIRFLTETPRYSKYESFLHMETLAPELVTKFTEFLKATCKGSEARKMFFNFKRVVALAIDDVMLHTNSCKGIVIKHDRHYSFFIGYFSNFITLGIEPVREKFISQFKIHPMSLLSFCRNRG